MLGAGLDKIAKILDTSTKAASIAVESFLENTPGLKALKEQQIPRDADRGYFVGLDGRLVPVDNAHLVLAGYLQNGESTIMKLANTIWRDDLRKENIWFKQCNFVHDEWQTRTLNSPKVVQRVSEIQKASLTTAGQILKMRCPLIGQSKVGFNWKETH